MLFFSVSPFVVSFLHSRLMFCGYHKVCIKQLIDKIILFLLIASYLHLSIWVLSFSSSPFLFLLSQILLLMLCVCYQIEAAIVFLFVFFAFLSLFNLYAIIKCLKYILIKNCIFKNSVIPFINLLKVLCTLASLFLEKEILATFLVRQV